MTSKITPCPGADDPAERCPRHPKDCTCWKVDREQSRSAPPVSNLRVNRLRWEAHGEGYRGCGPIIYDVYPASEGGGWWAALSMAGYLPYRERLPSPEAAKEAAQQDYEVRIRDALAAHAPVSNVSGSIPAGYALVPIEPTQEMVDAAEATTTIEHNFCEADLIDIYKSMVLEFIAAPAQSKVEGTD